MSYYIEASIYSSLIPLIGAVMIRKNWQPEMKVFSALILIGAVTAIGTKGIDNHVYYRIYTVTEFVCLLYVLLSFLKINRTLSLIPVTVIFLNDITATIIECSTLFILSLYAVSQLTQNCYRRFYQVDHRMLIVIGVLIYSINALTYSYSEYGTILFSVLNVTANIIFYKSLREYANRYSVYCNGNNNRSIDGILNQSIHSI